MTELRTGRALQLEGLQFAQNKVTLGFKCEAGTKIQLAQEAQQTGMTLSEYVDTVISTRHSQKQAQANSSFSSSELSGKLEQSKKRIHTLDSSLKFYEENPFLQKIFNHYRGQTIPYVDYRGVSHQIVINHVSDIFSVLVSSFKIS